jgi:hypothetical protein
MNDERLPPRGQIIQGHGKNYSKMKYSKSKWSDIEYEYIAL